MYKARLLSGRIASPCYAANIAETDNSAFPFGTTGTEEKETALRPSGERERTMFSYNKLHRKFSKYKRNFVHASGYSWFLRYCVNTTEFRRLAIWVTGCSIIIFALFAIAVNLMMGSTAIVYAIVTAMCIPLFGLFRLAKNPYDFTIPMWSQATFMLFMGTYLLFFQNSQDYSNLGWFMLYPPIVMTSMGLRHGTWACAIMMVFLFISYFAVPDLLFTPLNIAQRVRLPFMMFGSICFAWVTELLRHYATLALHEALDRQITEARTDHLTGLGNRRDYEKLMPWLLSKTTRSVQPFSLILLDIDHFKKYNDMHGHSVGDKALKHLTSIMISCIRTSDYPIRWGGEEFLVLLPDTPYEVLQVVSERIRKTVKDTPMVLDGCALPMTVSIGAHTTSVPCLDAEELVSIADKNLYRAKRTGRDRVVTTNDDLIMD